MTPNKYILAIIALSVIDILYTAIGAFYGGGGAELNPLLSWITDPAKFVLGVILIKTTGVILIVKIVEWVGMQDKPADIIKARHVALVGVYAYGVLLLGCLAVNVGYQLGLV